MSNQATVTSALSETPEPPGPTPGLDVCLARYQAALDTFACDPTKLVQALMARDRIDAELRHRIQPGGLPSLDYDFYQRRFDRLQSRLAELKQDPRDALIYKHRLFENLDQAKYGDTEALGAERAKVIDQLNRLTLATVGLPFSDLITPTQDGGTPAPDDPSNQLVALDERLRTLAFHQFKALASLPDWRASLNIPSAAWWWLLDQQFEATEHDGDFLWYLGAGLCTMVSLTVSIEIIKRLWSQAPDVIAIFGTLLTLLLTSSPLIKQGREVGLRVVQYLPWLNPRYRGETAFGATALSMVLVLGGWFSLPLLGRLYNDWGDAALRNGDLVAAEQWLQRATAVNPDLPVAYYNLAAFYEASGAPDEAILWYRNSIKHDRQFRPAYFGLGSLYNRQGNFALAEQLLLTGLNITNPREGQDLTTYADYMLLSNLGWTLVAQGRLTRGEEILREALGLEGRVAENDRGRLAHYYMALVHCRLGRPQAATDEIQETLRFGDPERREYKIWTATVKDYLDAVETGTPACANLPTFTLDVSTDLPTMRSLQ